MESLVNFQLITNEISVKNNNLPAGSFTLSPKISRSINKHDERHYSVQLVLDVSNTSEAPFPVNIKVDLIGLFEIEKMPEEGINDFLRYQAVQIMFPYIRSMVSAVTATANMVPVVLPIIDVRNLFPDDQ
ncbi:MAG: protein-export chaperone SecB [Spirochaetales bacterium]|nr:protein-export chaperone SecB [Bacillota bacterium]MBQ6261702.1 protein-export chaperone SecB [Bacillota bacterium]MBQ7643457.1 protein-export chaperone SecB [Spirochaetales bacterium]